MANSPHRSNVRLFSRCRKYRAPAWLWSRARIELDDEGVGFASAIAGDRPGEMSQQSPKFIAGRRRRKIAQHPDGVATLENAGNSPQVVLQHSLEALDVRFMPMLVGGNQWSDAINDHDLALAPRPVRDRRRTRVVREVLSGGIRGKFKQGIKAEVADFMVLKCKLSSDSGRHGRST